MSKLKGFDELRAFLLAMKPGDVVDCEQISWADGSVEFDVKVVPKIDTLTSAIEEELSKREM